MGVGKAHTVRTRRSSEGAAAVTSGGSHMFRAQAQTVHERLVGVGGAHVCTHMVVGMHRRRGGYAPTSGKVCTDVVWVCTEVALQLHRH